MQLARDCFFCKLPLYSHHLQWVEYTTCGNGYHNMCGYSVADTHKKLTCEIDFRYYKPYLFNQCKKFINHVKKVYARAKKEGIEEDRERRH